MTRADFLQRSELLFGSSSIERLEAACIVICGLGGVGSYAAEAVARAGIGRIILIDFDMINISNINRQLPALHSTVGRSKAEVVSERLRDINPQAEVKVIAQRLTAENAAELLQGADYCIDAIDDVRAKTALIRQCLVHGSGIVSVMGTGNKLRPELLELADIAKTHTCPLARAVRLALRKEGIEQGVRVVFSAEQPHKAINEDNTVGSCSFVPSVAGLLAASVAIRDIAGQLLV